MKFGGDCSNHLGDIGIFVVSKTILLPIRCLYERRSFDQQRLLGSTVLSTTPTPRDNTDKDYARSIDTDIFADKDTRIAQKNLPSRTDAVTNIPSAAARLSATHPRPEKACDYNGDTRTFSYVRVL